MEQQNILFEYIEKLKISKDSKVKFIGKSFENINLIMQRDGLTNFEELFSEIVAKNEKSEDFKMPEEISKDPYDIYNLIDYLGKYEPESDEDKVCNILKQLMTSEKSKEIKDTWERSEYKIFAAQREENAGNLIKNFGIPKSEQDVELLLKQFSEKDINVGNYAVTYASMLCEETPEGNRYVDELISRIVAQSSQENLDRVTRNFRRYRRTVTGAEEYEEKQEGLVNFYGCEFAPKNPETRRRMLINVFKGIVKNENTTINDITNIMQDNPKIKSDFISEQWKVLQESIANGRFEFNGIVKEDDLYKIALEAYPHAMDLIGNIENSRGTNQEQDK